MANQVIISSDISTLGPEATESDLERYRSNLEFLLNAEFGETYVYARSVAETQVQTGSDELSDRVEQIESGDEWQRLAFGG